MKQLLILLFAVMASCTNPQLGKQQENKESNKKDNALVVPLNKRAKWKADGSTKKNVVAMMQEVNDTIYADAKKREQLYESVQSGIDTLVKQCSMKGEEHNALHIWLERVVEDVNELKREDNEYSKAYAALKKDVESFYNFFE